MIPNSIRVVVVDNSPLASLALTGLLQSDPQISVVGVARDGREALEMVPRLKPDLVTMDVWMPHVDGFTAVEQLMACHPLPILVITSSLTRRDVNISLTMLNAGALDVFEKPVRRDEVAWERARRQLIQRVKILARVPVHGPAGRRATGPPAGSTAPRPTPAMLPAHAWAGGPVSALVDRTALPLHGRAAAGHRYEVVAIVASTGGPQALLTILLNLPDGFTTPVLIVQHIAAGFTQGLADWLGRESGRTVRPAVAGERPVPGAARWRRSWRRRRSSCLTG